MTKTRSTASREKLTSSLLPSQKMFSRWRSIRLALLLAKEQEAEDGQHRDEQGEARQAAGERGEAERFGEGTDRDAQEIHGRKSVRHESGESGERGDRRQQPGELHRRYRCEDAGGEEGRHLRPREYRYDQAIAGHRDQVEERADAEGGKTAVKRHAEEPDRHREQAEKADVR